MLLLISHSDFINYDLILICLELLLFLLLIIIIIIIINI